MLPMHPTGQGRAPAGAALLAATALFLACAGASLLAEAQVAPVDLFVNMTETGKIFSYYSDFFVVNVEGSFELYNPYNASLMNIHLPYDILSLQVIETNRTAHIEAASEFYFIELEPGDRITVPYRIIGITPEYPRIGGYGVMRSGFIRGTPVIYSHLMGVLQKASLENETFTGRPGRLVSVYLNNTTPFAYNMTRVSVIKTHVRDPNQQLAEWNFPPVGESRTMDPYSVRIFDLIDTNASEGEIYWLVSDVPILADLIEYVGSNTVEVYEIENLSMVAEIGVNASENETGNRSLMAQGVFLRKQSSLTLINPGEEVRITLKLDNLEPTAKRVTVYDAYPVGFELVTTVGVNITGTNLSWTVLVNPNSLNNIEYALRFSDASLVGLNSFPRASAVFGNQTVYSKAVPFIMQYIPERRVFIQKKLEYVSDRDIKVTLELRNLGEKRLENILVKETLLAYDSFQEISQTPKAKGLWEIANLSSGGAWTVTYITDEHERLTFMPEVYGVERGEVFRTLIMESVIYSHFRLGNIKVIEWVGIVVLILVPFSGLIIRKVAQKTVEVKVDAVSRRIQELKEATRPDDQAEIDRLRAETGHQRHADAAAPPHHYADAGAGGTAAAERSGSHGHKTFYWPGTEPPKSMDERYEENEDLLSDLKKAAQERKGKRQATEEPGEK